MDLIVDRLSAIEQSASRILAAATQEKERLKAASQAEMDAYDDRIDGETKQRLSALQKNLEDRMQEALARDRREAEGTQARMEADYEARHEILADQILKQVIKG